MKTIGRILIILAVALVVSGVFWVLTGSGQAASAGFFGEERIRPEGFQPGGNFAPQGDFAPREGGREGGFERGERDGGFFNPFGLLKTLIPVSVIVAVVVLIERFATGRRIRAMRG